MQAIFIANYPLLTPVNLKIACCPRLVGKCGFRIPYNEFLHRSQRQQRVFSWKHRMMFFSTQSNILLHLL